MKKFLALFLTLTLLAGLTACKGREAIAEAQVVHVVTAPTNDAAFVYEPEDPTQVLPGGQTIALVTGPAGTDSGEDAMLLKIVLLNLDGQLLMTLLVMQERYHSLWRLSWIIHINGQPHQLL